MQDRDFKSDKIKSDKVDSKQLETQNLKIKVPTEAGWILRTNNVGDIYPSPMPSIESKIVKNEIPSGEIDGVNRYFTLAHEYEPNSLLITLNGLKLKINSDYIELGSNLIMMLEPPQEGDELIVDYIRK